jgi:hypothetical protein
MNMQIFMNNEDWLHFVLELTDFANYLEFFSLQILSITKKFLLIWQGINNHNVQGD